MPSPRNGRYRDLIVLRCYGHLLTKVRRKFVNGDNTVTSAPILINGKRIGLPAESGKQLFKEDASRTNLRIMPCPLS